ncbi:MAG: tetratricopeptide (TPR) repeat protein [Myxococcota bacterium]|jgi:tetratricopeptide (TPR) repeat protein
MDLTPIEEKLAGGDIQGAVTALRAAMGHPQVAGPDAWRETAELLVRIAGDDAPDLARCARRLAADPDALQALYDTGFQLFEVGLFDLAAAAFARAEAGSPGLGPIVSELVASLEELGRYDEASHLLQRHPQLLDDGFLFVYLAAFNGILAGKPERARELLPRLQPSDDRERFMADRIHRMLARVAHIRPVTGLGCVDLRGWHYALTGGALLHLSSAGYEDAMRGRYAYVQDRLSLCRAAVDQVASLLRATGKMPERILLLPERGSEALGRALASVLSLPTADFAPEATGLGVAYDLDSLPMQLQVALRHHRPDQRLWAHATCWTTPPICAPDIVTYLYQVNAAPWEPGLGLDDDAPSAVTGGAEQLTAAILAADPEAEDAHPEQRAPLWAALATAQGRAEAALSRETGTRERLWYMGPVFSNRF